MRKLIIATLLALLVASSFSACPNADEFELTTGVCKKCSDTANKGIEGCNACTLTAAADVKVTCSACVAGKFLAANACTACDASCATCTAAGDKACATCADGKFLTGEKACSACTSPCSKCTETATKCTGCINGRFLDAAANTCEGTCKEASCKTCTDGTIAGCTACNDANFQDTDKSCKACGDLCGTCSSATACSKCANAAAPQFISVSPADGKCVAACAAPKNQGLLSDLTTKTCSGLLAPKRQTLNATYNVPANNNTLKVSLCAPGSADAAVAKTEKVGAVGVILSGSATEDLSISTRAAIKTLSGKTAAFDTENTYVVQSNKIYFNLIGTEAGDATLDTKVFRRNSTLKYICVNVDNVVSDAGSHVLVANQTANRAVNFRVAFNKSLNASELNTVTCSVAVALFDADSSKYSLLTNQQGKYCNQSAATRVLQASVNDAFFQVAANQVDDAYSATITAKTSKVDAAIKSFASSVGASLVGAVSAVEIDPTVTPAAPKVTIVSQAINPTNFSVNVSVDSPATLYLALANTTLTEAAVRTGAGAVDFTSGEHPNSAAKLYVFSKNLVANSQYTVYYRAVSQANPTLQSEAGKFINVTTASAGSFSAILSLSFLVLLVLAFLF